jgi:hypothetical protein
VDVLKLERLFVQDRLRAYIGELPSGHVCELLIVA